MPKPIIGSRKYAARALSIHDGERGPGRDFVRIGSGSMRDCWLHKPTGVVYKVQTWDFEDYTNSTELRNARALRRRQFNHVYIPKTSGFHIDGTLVLAMEHVKGVMGKDVKRSDHKPMREELFNLGFEDMHGDNFMFTTDGKIAPVDMGSPRKGKREADRRVLSCGDGDVWG